MNSLKMTSMLLGSCLAALILASCAGIRQEAGQPGAPELQMIGKPLIADVIDGLSKNDYRTFTRDFTSDLKSRFPEQDFNASLQPFHDKYGKLESMQYLGTLKINGLDVLMWKAKFSKNKNDVFVRLVMGKVDDKYRIFGWSIE